MCQQKVNLELSNHSLRNMLKATEQLKLAIKSTPAKRIVPPPEVIIIDDNTKDPALISSTIPCYRARHQVANDDDVILIE